MVFLFSRLWSKVNQFVSLLLGYLGLNCGFLIRCGFVIRVWWSADQIFVLVWDSCSNSCPRRCCIKRRRRERGRERGKKWKKRPKNAEASTPDPADDRDANDNVESKMLTSRNENLWTCRVAFHSLDAK